MEDRASSYCKPYGWFSLSTKALGSSFFPPSLVVEHSVIAVASRITEHRLRVQAQQLEHTGAAAS